MPSIKARFGTNKYFSHETLSIKALNYSYDSRSSSCSQTNKTSSVCESNKNVSEQAIFIKNG